MATSWDLLIDGVLWKAALAGFEPDPEFEGEMKRAVARMQEGCDRSDPAQFSTADKRAANYVRKVMVIKAESAHRRLQTKSAKRALPAGTQISTEELAAASFPEAVIAERILRYEAILNKGDHFDALELEKQQLLSHERRRLAAKKPAQPAGDATQKTEKTG